MVHVVMIQGWNKVYRKVATRLTERENHCTEDVSDHTEYTVYCSVVYCSIVDKIVYSR